MTDELIDSDEAADVLGVNRQWIAKLVRTGRLCPHPSSPSMVVDRRFLRSDVTALKEIRELGKNPEAAYVEAKKSALETRAMRLELDRLKFVLGLDSKPLPLDRDSVVSLLLKAEDALNDPGYRDPEVLLSWARVLHMLTESHYEAITFYTDLKEPWRAFLNLGRQLCASQDFTLTKYDADLAGIYSLLHAALKTARRTAYFHVRNQHGGVRAWKIFREVYKFCDHEDVIALAFSGGDWNLPQLSR